MILHKCATPRLNIQPGDTRLPASHATIGSAEMAKTRASVYNATLVIPSGSPSARIFGVLHQLRSEAVARRYFAIVEDLAIRDPTVDVDAADRDTQIILKTKREQLFGTKVQARGPARIQTQHAAPFQGAKNDGAAFGTSQDNPVAASVQMQLGQLRFRVARVAGDDHPSDINREESGQRPSRGIPVQQCDVVAHPFSPVGPNLSVLTVFSS